MRQTNMKDKDFTLSEKVKKLEEKWRFNQTIKWMN